MLKRMMMGLVLSFWIAGMSLASVPSGVAAQASCTDNMVGRGGYALRVFNCSQLAPDTLTKLIDQYFYTINAAAARFNRTPARFVTLLILNNLQCWGNSPAGCTWWENGYTYIGIDGEDLRKFPAGYDVITHEAFHVVQEPQASVINQCLYWIEGEAEYARALFGQNLAAAGWSLPRPDPRTHYTSSYAITAGFLYWLSFVYGEQLIFKLDATLRAGVCPAQDLWSAETRGATIEQLWQAYVTGRII